MSKFKITVARIEVDARGKQDALRITFRVDSIRDFDDTEMVRAARSALHQKRREQSRHRREHFSLNANIGAYNRYLNRARQGCHTGS
jgi:hypothetical protein